MAFIGLSPFMVEILILVLAPGMPQSARPAQKKPISPDLSEDAAARILAYFSHPGAPGRVFTDTPSGYPLRPSAPARCEPKERRWPS